MGGGGGGDGGYQARLDEQERRKAAARAALNVNFGIAPEGATGADQSPAASGLLGKAADLVGDVYAPQRDAELSSQAQQAAANKAALDALYSGVRTNAYNAGKTRLDEQKSKAGRDLKFELFARGLNGGSVDVDQNALLGRTYTQGLTDLGAKADAAATGLRSNDEQTRLGLLQSIDNGMDQSSAISSALAQLKNNSDKAAAEATGTSLGNLFADSGLLYEQERRAQGVSRAMTQNPFNLPGYGSGSSGARRGVSSWAG